MRNLLTLGTIVAGLLASISCPASPPAVGLASDARSCLACHANTGPWSESPGLIFDMLDKTTMKSLRQPDGAFEITAKRGVPVSVITVLGYEVQEKMLSPHRNGWIFVDTTMIGTNSVSKFAPGWEADVLYGCKIVGDKSPAYPQGAITTAPLTVRPTDLAKDAEISWQVMLTSGEAVKGKPKEGLVSNYFTRTVRLKVTD